MPFWKKATTLFICIHQCDCYPQPMEVFQLQQTGFKVD